MFSVSRFFPFSFSFDIARCFRFCQHPMINEMEEELHLIYKVSGGCCQVALLVAPRWGSHWVLEVENLLPPACLETGWLRFGDQ